MCTCFIQKYFFFSPMCVYSNSRNDVPRVAQRYGTIAAHTRRRASALVVFVLFNAHMHSFAGLIRRTPPPTFSDTAITDRHSDTTIFQLRAHWVRYPGLLDRKNRSDMCPRWESNPRLPACKASTLSTMPGSPLFFSPNTLRRLIYWYCHNLKFWSGKISRQDMSYLCTLILVPAAFCHFINL